MEAFSLLKYWRSSNNTSTTTTSSNTNSIVTTLKVVSRPNSLLRHQIQTQEADYIDIDFTSIEVGEEKEEEEEEEEATVTVEVEDTNSKHNFLPNSLLKSATKFKVLNFKSKKPKESNINQLGNKSEGFGNKRLRKEVINGYMSKIMPLYVKVRGSGDEKIRCGPGLGKCRSAAAVAAVPSPPRRKDDSLMQQEDGIQGAIAHCKRSFNVTRAETKDVESTLARSKSDSYNERLIVLHKS